MVYDVDEGRVIVAGGIGFSGREYLTDAWTWDGMVWKEIRPAGILGLSPLMVYDTTRKEIVAFRGVVTGTYFGTYDSRVSATLNDTWLIAALPLDGVRPAPGVRDFDGDSAGDLLWRNGRCRLALADDGDNGSGTVRGK